MVQPALVFARPRNLLNVDTWNARNQLITRAATSFQYDSFGRRTLNAAGNNLLYEGADVGQEISAGTPVANRILGGTDEFFSRTDLTGDYNPITDALGSVMALTNFSGNIVTQYGYDPYGNTVGYGGTSTNAFQYTGRENDGNGLYFYRARYYNPALQRFISEDPLGFAGSGPNFYVYAGNDPINFSDPLGLYNGWDFLQDAGSFSEAFADTLTFGSASRLNDALGANVAVNRCGWAHGTGTVVGIAASIPLGGEAFPAALKWLPNGAKGAIGEGLSVAKNTLSGGTLVGRQISAADQGLNGLTTVFDSVWEAGGQTYYVESKFGTSGLTSAQRLAANALGDAYQVERWTYPFFGQVGGYLGAAGGAAGAMAGRNCGCN